MIEFWLCGLLILAGALMVTLIIIGIALIRCKRMKKNSNPEWGTTIRPYYHTQDGSVSVPLMFPYEYVNEFSHDNTYASY